jgi:hypothetical protein
VPRAALVPAACAAVAALSLLLPWDLSFDPWGWVLWGREITSSHIAFSTALYPAWKPLAVMFTTVFSLFGDAGPELWLVIARAGALLGVVFAYRLGTRLGGRVGGVGAAVGLLLLPESLRYFAGGTSESLLVALVLGAIDRHLSGRRGQALGLAFAAALLRPEVWPFLLAYAVVYAGGRPRRLAVVATLGVAVPALWFVPEWIGAGDPFYGAWVARASMEAHQTQKLASPELAALGRALGLALAPLAVAALVAVVEAARRRRPLELTLAGAALAWVAIVVAMTAQGYAGLARFSLPAGAVICVLGGAGVAHLVELAPPDRRWLAIAAALVVCLPFAVARVERIAPAAAVATQEDGLEDRFPAVVADVGGPARVLRCRRFTVEGLFRPPIAWRLGVPIKRLVEVRKPLLVFRLTKRVLRSFEGTERLRRVAPVRPIRRIARLGGWDALASARRRSSCA